MSVPWKDKRHVVDDLDQLCDMYEPKDKKAPVPDIKLLTMEKNPSPETVVDDTVYLPHGIDLTEDDLDIKPDLNFITAMLRNVAPSYSNDFIEEAFGHGGRLLDQSRQVAPHQPWGNSKHSAGNSNHIPTTDGDGDSLKTKLNPYSGEFVPKNFSNVPSGDSVEPIPMKTPEKKSTTKLNPHTPEFKPSRVNRYSGHETTHSATPSPRSVAEVTKSPGKSESKLEPYRYLAAEASLSVKPSTSSVAENTMSPGKSGAKLQPYRHLASEPSPKVNPKVKRNCVMQNILQFTEGESAKTFANIEVNHALFPNFGVQKRSAEQNADCNPATMDGGNEINSKLPTETATEDSVEIFDDSSESTEDSATAARELIEARRVYGFVESRSTPPSIPVAGPSNRKHIISSDSKKKVLSWLSSDCNASKTDATRNAKIPDPPKPKPFELDDDAFTFIKKKQSVSESVQTASKPKAKEESKSEERITNLELEGACAAQAQSPSPKKPTVQDIYNSLKAKQERRIANNANNTTGTYESFIGNESRTYSSNTVWDNIKVSKHKEKRSKDSKK